MLTKSFYRHKDWQDKDATVLLQVILLLKLKVFLVLITILFHAFMVTTAIMICAI